MYTSEKIDINFLLRYLSEETLMSEYLGIPVQFTHLVCNPLRKDNSPTCGFQYDGGRLYFKDFGVAEKRMDFLNIVQRRFRLGYNDACRKVYHDFMGRKSAPKQVGKPVAQIRKDTELRIASRAWEQRDRNYWKAFGISVSTLTKFNVVPISHYWLNGNQFEVNERCYAYRFGNYKYKLYFVDRPKGIVRFIQNCSNIVLGVNQMPKKFEVGLLTKALKDVMTWDSWNDQGVYAFCGLNENQIIPADVIEDVRGRCTILYSLYDWDSTGIAVAQQHKKLYNIKPLFFQPKHFATYYQRNSWLQLPETAKDTSDTRALENGKETIQTLVNYIKNHDSYKQEIELKDVPFW